MPEKRYIVDLTPEERASLTALTRKGKAAEGLTNAAIALQLNIRHATVERARQRAVC
jgi:DNA-binding NarL/FixJ family response regulator